ncbi:MAG: DUF262 domain-containing protein [Bacteroidales bacterium]
MKATEANLLNLMKMPQQFIIPIYQRSYNWKEKHCDQLLKDILRISQDENSSGHFIGSIVYFQEGIINRVTIPQLVVIDGQQRLTTISLILIVLIKVIRENNLEIEIPEKKIRNYYLINSEEEGQLKYKLILTRKDSETLINLLEGRDLDSSSSRDLIGNYNFFLARINKENARHVWNGLQRLFIVDVALEYGKDNPQLIFESLNSTGLDLSQADLIRNFVLMGLKPDIQKDLYERYWFPMERLFGERYSEFFDGFIRDYLTLKTNSIPRIDKIYEDFKNFVRVNGKPINIEDVVADLYKYAKYYVRFALLQEKSPKLLRILSNLESLKVNVSYPFLLFLYNDFNDGDLSDDDFVKILELIESYVYRRSVCGVPTNSLNKTFAGFKRHVVADKYVESVLAHFLLLDSYRRFPSDREFQDMLQVKDLYNTRLIKYALDKIENFRRKEKVNVDDYTIEHIIPQNPNLSLEWRQMLGENSSQIQEKYLHTLGNLTLTGYNSELSDRCFDDKKTMEGGFADSPIRLNEGLGILSKWDEDEIIKRASVLGQKSLQIWGMPHLDEGVLNIYKPIVSKKSSRIPNNLIELIRYESTLEPAPTSAGYIRFKPKLLSEIRDRLIERKFIGEDLDLNKSSLFWYDFVIGTDSIKFYFYLGEHPDHPARHRIFSIFTRYIHYFPNFNRTFRSHWFCIFSKNIITADEYEQYADDEDNTELFALIEERFRDLIDNDLPKMNEMILALVE